MQGIVRFQSFMGNGLIVEWYLISILYLMLREKRKQMRILFIYVPLALLLLFFNPLFTKLVLRMEDIYWRLLWLLPITMTLAYAAVTLYGRMKGKIRMVFALLLAALVMFSGNYIYDDGFVQAENPYHMPQAVVDICDAIEIEGREVMALFPDELLVYVRQYAPTVCMPYGREVFSRTTDLHVAVQEEVIDAQKLAVLAKAQGCHYVILPESREMRGSLLEYDYELFADMDGYEIYKDTTMYFGY